MILDERLEFADAASVAAAAGTTLLGDVIDLGSVTRDVGNGEPIFFGITVDTEIITGGTAGTIEFRLVSDAQAAIAVDGTATVHASSGSLVTDDAAANDARLNVGGTIYFGSLPAGANYERYLGVLLVVGTTTITAGKVNAFLTRDQHGWRAYSQGNVG